jgi:predicted N-acyltransferase
MPNAISTPRKPASRELSYRLSIHHRLADIPPAAWDALGEADHPFTRHAFLDGLEQHGCLLPWGWQPAHFTLHDGDRLVAALPAYIKDNSYGELVFDHAWAGAFQRSGRDYYPKLVSAIPYTPATGPRLLLHRAIEDEARRRELRQTLVDAALAFCEEQGLSGWHLLFEREATLDRLADERLILRYDCQFHWHNRGYRRFDDFLAALKARKRKNIRRERQRLRDSGLCIERRSGQQLDSDEWARIHQLYAGIFDEKYGAPTLSADFFRHLGASLGDQVMLVLARAPEDDRILAVSLFLHDRQRLYGRIWGCSEQHEFLHFECCYYQGIEYCIERGLAVFDPGAQGEHKVPRGFLPTRTVSAHWLADRDFHALIGRHVRAERGQVAEYCAYWQSHSPYRETEDA